MVGYRNSGARVGGEGGELIRHSDGRIAEPAAGKSVFGHIEYAGQCDGVVHQILCMNKPRQLFSCRGLIVWRRGRDSGLPAPNPFGALARPNWLSCQFVEPSDRVQIPPDQFVVGTKKAPARLACSGSI